MIRSIGTILFLLFVNVFVAQGKKISVTGELENAEGITVKLNKFVNNQQVTIDSAVTNKKGKFKLATEATNQEFFTLMLTEGSYALIVLDDKNTEDEIEVKGDAKAFVRTYTVEGSEASSRIADFTKIVFEYQEQKQAFAQKMQTSGVSFEERNNLQNKMDSIDNQFVLDRNEFIDQNQKSVASIVAIGYLNPIDDVDQLRKIEKGLAETMPESEYYLGVKTQLTQVETQIKIQEEQLKKQKEQEARTAIGAVAPELGFKSPTGELITLESLRGNYVLIDFWASWCRPCRMENPNVVKLYNKYADDGFTVYSVSLDKNKASWENAILQDGLIWPNHVSDLKQWQTEATKIYGFNGIPYTVLIDPDGKIIAKKLRGQALEMELEKIFGH